MAEPIVNPVSGELKEITLAEVKEMFDESVHSNIDTAYGRPGVDALVVYENIDFASSSFGERSALVVGPRCSVRTLEDAAKQPLGATPSQFQYPRYYTKKELSFVEE